MWWPGRIGGPCGPRRALWRLPCRPAAHGEAGRARQAHAVFNMGLSCARGLPRPPDRPQEQAGTQLGAARGSLAHQRLLTHRRRRRPSPLRRRSPAARRRRQAQLVQLLAFALLVALFSGSTSYSMHAGVQPGEGSARPAAATVGTSTGIASQPRALSGLRGWLAGPHARGRSLSERWPGSAELAARGLDSGLRDPGTQGAQLFGQWWLLGAFELTAGGGEHVQAWAPRVRPACSSWAPAPGPRPAARLCLLCCGC